MTWAPIVLTACAAVGGIAAAIYAAAIWGVIREAREDARVTDYLDR